MSVRTGEWLTKVPAITAAFWVIKVLSTTVGETVADYRTVSAGLGAAATGATMLALLAGALVRPFRTRAYTRVKDLEVVWDDAEAGLEPRDSARWHQLDDQIDAVLTALRSSTPTQATCASPVSALMQPLNTFDGI